MGDSLQDGGSSGAVSFNGHRTWYRVTGEIDGGAIPLVTLHGGPGATHDYILAIAGIAGRGRPVIHYDQLGNGRSTHLPDEGPDFWTVSLFLAELDRLLDHLGISDSYHLLGQSWGGMLAAEHAVRRPAGLRSLVLADSPASMRLWVQEANRLREDLPPDVQATLLAHEQAGTTDDPAYAEASQVFYDRHVCRVVPNPPEVTASFAAIAADPTVYHTMNGPSEFHTIGTLVDWDITDRLHNVAVPTLVVSGKYDEATPATVKAFLDHIPGARWELFEHSSHMPHVEETDRYLQVVGDFLDEHS
jgi:L-proline amide hydrolase